MDDKAKQYAARNRQGSDWFSHDSGTSASDVPTSPAAKSEQPLPTSDRVQMIKPSTNSNDW